MADAIRVNDGVTLPAGSLEVRAVRSSGPGGQNVNKVASKIELVLDVALVPDLTLDARARLLALAGKKADTEGRVHVTCEETRDQHRNLETAREKLAALVSKALVVPKARRITRPSRAAKERRLTEKHKKGTVKVLRKSRSDD